MIIKKLPKVLLLYTLIVFISCKKNAAQNKTKEQPQQVFLKGKFKDEISEDALTMINFSKNSLFFEEEFHRIPLDEDQSFTYTFSIDSPGYYAIGRSYLYLTPGDSLDMILTEGRKSASFKGKGAEVNNYLTAVTYPKGGSFWGDFRNGSENEKITDYKQAPTVFKKILDKRIAHLETLKNAPKEFVELEKARLRFDYVNSLGNLFYLYINDVRSGKITQQDMDNKLEEAATYFAPHIKEIIGDYNNIKYIQLEVFQSLLYDLKQEDFIEKHQLVQLNEDLKEYVLTNDLIYGFNNNGYTKNFITKYKEERKKIKNEDYLLALDKKESKYASLMQGNIAPDFELTNLNGETVKLSDYKGKVIVVDLWATWCGPCMYEKPYFEALEQQYETNDNIILLSVSIDKKHIWKSYFKNNEVKGHQLQTLSTNLEAYQVASIPRFFVIDKNFKIVDVFAPVPSSGELVNIIKTTI